MSSTNYLSAGFDPATDFLGGDDHIIGAMYEEDEAFVMGMVPDDQFGAAASGQTARVQSAIKAMKSAKMKASGLQKALASGRVKGAQAAAVSAQIAQESARVAKLASAVKTSQRRRQAKAAGGTLNAQLDGAGSLQYTVEAPPGVGRLDRIGFTIQNLGGLPVAGAAINAVGDPQIVIPAGTGAGNCVMTTPQISWAVVRIVGVEITRTINNPGGGAPDLIQITNFNIGGGADLLIQAGGVDLAYFASGLNTKVGLRDFPILRSPNQAFLNVAWANAVAGANTTAGDHIVGFDLIVDVLADDNFGAHLPGAYARTDSLIRKPVGRR